MDLRPALALEKKPDGTCAVLDRAGQARHPVPPKLAASVEAAFVEGSPRDPEAAAWLELRHLAMSDRVQRVEAWAASRLPRAVPRDKRPITMLPRSRFTCHGCGMCCESYVAGPVSGVEREKILARASDLAPHVRAPVESWFVPTGDPGAPTWFLGRKPSGACVFLGDDRLCGVHKHLGVDVKPWVCRAFPLEVTHRPDVSIVTLRVECETFARSRDDGQPLEEQLEWVRRIVAEDPSPRVLPPVLGFANDVFVPLPFALAIQQRTLATMRAAPTVEIAHLAIRDLLFGVSKLLPPAPDVDALERAEAFVASASIEEASRACDPIEPARALSMLVGLLERLVKVSPRFLSLNAQDLPEGEVSIANGKLAVDLFRGLCGALAARFGGPLPERLPPESVDEGKRAFAVPSSSDDPKVIDFVRECFVQLIASGRPLAAKPGILYGYGHLALTHLLARFGARLLASRRGAVRAAREDWNHALAVLDRTLLSIELAGLAPAVTGLYADLFSSDDLPS